MEQNTNQPGQTGSQQQGQRNVQQPTGAVTSDNLQRSGTQTQPGTQQQPGQRTLNSQGQQVGPDGLTDEQRKQKEVEDKQRAEMDERARRGL